MESIGKKLTKVDSYHVVPLALVDNFFIFQQGLTLKVYDIVEAGVVDQHNLHPMDSCLYLCDDLLAGMFVGKQSDVEFIKLTKEGVIVPPIKESSQANVYILLSWKSTRNLYYIHSINIVEINVINSPTLSIKEKSKWLTILDPLAREYYKILSLDKKLFPRFSRLGFKLIQCKKTKKPFFVYEHTLYYDEIFAILGDESSPLSSNITESLQYIFDYLFIFDIKGYMLGFLRAKPGLISLHTNMGIYGRYFYLCKSRSIIAFDIFELQKPSIPLHIEDEKFAFKILFSPCKDVHCILYYDDSPELDSIWNPPISSLITPKGILVGDILIPYIEITRDIRCLPKRLQREIIYFMILLKKLEIEIPNEIKWYVISFLLLH